MKRIPLDIGRVKSLGIMFFGNNSECDKVIYIEPWQDMLRPFLSNCMPIDNLY